MDIRTSVPTIFKDWNDKFGETWKTQIARLRERFGDAIEQVKLPVEDPVEVPVIYVKAEKIVEVLSFVKKEAGFEYAFLSDLTAIDNEEVPRFEVVYNLFSIESRARLRLKARVGENQEVPTASTLWKGADWAEREVYDMFGIRFKGHPDLRRILMDERWVGYPLRKDYPLKGYQLFSEPEPIHRELLD